MTPWERVPIDAMLRALRAGLFPAGVDVLGLVLALIGAQVALILGLLVYALLLRLWRRRRARRRSSLYTGWHYLVPAFLSGDIDESYLRQSLRPRDYPLFAEFLRPYLLDLRGSDAATLSGLLTRLGFKAYLRRALKHRDPWRRAYAVHFFALIADPAAAPLIRQALRDRSELVVFQAAEALMRLHDFASVPEVLERVGGLSHANRERLAVYLMEFGITALPVLQRIVREVDTPPWLMVLVLQVLAQYRFAPAAWDIVYRYMNSSHREVRIACVKALAACGEPTLVGFFEGLVRDADPVMQAEAAKALGEMGDASHGPLLAGLLSSEDFWVLKHAISSLARLGVLEETVATHDPRRRRFSRTAWALIREEVAERIRGKSATEVA